ncbi:MAG: tRNA (5-methylaminomethyl-2-thiouridine)(34)-methyltransferase MnmD [Amoebophilaceae bacterium]|jgi:tRNA U34 5-methylaminomethyl-2-thiouridine-forming methyltransferase MnmC|nr:tRNA (5-methylaminomethyl-2-thiouridine)(34)-methyltransferase MnmD [Amoebophilaceae bacterium]
MKQPQFIITGDGSHSLWIPDLDETYHSTHGAIQESKHVFIQHGLMHWLLHQTKSSVSILEIGMGTGLNVLLTYLNLLTTQVRTTYTGLEPYPIPKAYVQRLNYAAQLARETDCPITCQDLRATFERIHQGAATSSCHLSDHFLLQKSKCTLQSFCAPPNTFDLVYFDAFSPSKQPTLWESAVLQKIRQMMRNHGIMVTYCAQGKLKRYLKQVGMYVETLPGPPGKREVTRARKK